jgi:cell division septum initiation protein DivIVA
MSEEAVTTEAGGSPEFVVVVRGYDRDQVDTYVAELLSLIARLRQEVIDLREKNASGPEGPPTEEVGALEKEDSPAEEARAQTSASWEGLGPEVARLLEQAEVAARARLERAEQEATAIVEEAQRQENHAAAELEQLRRRWRDLVAQLEQVLNHARNA